MMVMWAIFSVPGWTFVDGLYWAAASLSTGGMWAIPPDSPPSYFAIAAAFSCLGIPIMATAFTSMIGLIFNMDNHLTTLLENVNDRVTEAEIELLQRFGIDNKDGFFDKKEFIILCAIRLNILMPSVIQYIVQRFDELDESGTGRLCYATAFKKYHSLVPSIVHTAVLKAEAAEAEEIKGDGAGEWEVGGRNTSDTKQQYKSMGSREQISIQISHSINTISDDIMPTNPSHASSQRSLLIDNHTKTMTSNLYIDTSEKGHNYDRCILHTSSIEQHDESSIQEFGISSAMLHSRDRSASAEGGNCEHIDRMVGA